MTTEQLAITAILIAALALFVWNRWRFDFVALLALVVCVLFGLVEPGAAVSGFAHPAVITVAAVLILSRGVAVSGLIDRLTTALGRLGWKPEIRFAALCAVAVAVSGFMNNIAALALLMPVAVATAEDSGTPPGRVLMPLSFCSILGGLTTMIGTPPNLIVAHARARAEESAFSLFDFAPVGVPLAILGAIFVLRFGARLTPWERGGSTPRPRISDYLAELHIPPEAEFVGRTADEIAERIGRPLSVVGLVRDGVAQQGDLARRPLQAEDTLLVRGDIAALRDVVGKAGLELTADDTLRERMFAGGLSVIEAVVPPRSRLHGRSAHGFRLRERLGLNLLAVSRQGRFMRDRLGDLVFQPGDVLLLQGEAKTLPEKVSALEAVPLSGVQPVAMARPAWLAPTIFVLGVATIVAGLASPAVALTAAAAAMVLSGVLTPRMAWDALDLPVLVLLGAMLPVGGALETTGTTNLIADAILAAEGDAPAALILLVLMAATIGLSNVMNNAATAVIMTPIAFGLAEQMGVDADPLLMGVAVAASCAFLTPIGHQNNALVMGPGGYRFGDYWRLGLPLEILIVAVSVLLIPMVWGW